VQESEMLKKLILLMWLNSSYPVNIRNILGREGLEL